MPTGSALNSTTGRRRRDPTQIEPQRQIDCDFHAYRWRHLVENVFCNFKAFRRIATRYENTD